MFSVWSFSTVERTRVFLHCAQKTRNPRSSEMIVSRSLSPPSWCEPSEMARWANFLPEYTDPIFLVVLVPSLNYESR